MRTKGSKEPPGKDEVLKHIAAAIIFPSNGPSYVRCRICKKQIFGLEARRLGGTRERALKQVILFLRERLARHLRAEHKG